ncbi:MAG: SGNH/GDSL hydrolase family protein [Solirubrobacterales bacterium]
MRGRTPFGALGAVVTVAVALVALAGTTSAAVAAKGGIYVSLGDSYTAAPLVLNQVGQPIDCARSDHNYPSLVAQGLGVTKHVDVSCSSAETKHMTEPQTGLPLGGTNPPQFDGLRRDADLVTVGIGGNDAGLVGVAEECAQLGFTDPNGTACRDHYAPGGNDTVEARIEEARPRIDAVLQGIHQRSPKARVAIVGYPNVLPIDGTNCYPMVPLSKDDVAYIDALIRRINQMIEDEAAANDAIFVDTYDDSIGHDVCKLPPTRWFEGLVPTEPAFPLHPNAKGEASMARSVLATLRKAPPAPVASITRLGVRPRPVHRDRAVRIRFRASDETSVEILRQRRGKTGSRPLRLVRGAGGRVDAGINRLRIPGRKLGRTGRWRLVVDPTGAGNATSRNYRVVRK